MNRLTGIVLLLLAGSANASTTRDFQEGLARLRGQPLTAAIALIGYPMSNLKVGGDTVYTWQRGYSSPTPNFGSIPLSGATEYRCTVRIAVGPDELIKRWEWDGDTEGCRPYAKALRRSR